MKSQRILTIIYLSTFLLILSLPFISLLSGFSIGPEVHENKNKTAFPTFKGDIERYKKNFELYINDNFGLKNLFLISNSALRYFVFNSPSSSQVLLGNDRSLFYKQQKEINDLRNLKPFSKKELKEWANALKARANYTKEKGGIYLLVIAPDSKSIYPERLPKWLKVNKGKSRLDQLYAYLEENTNINFLDIRPVLNKAKEVQDVYFKTDSHWNDEGAYLAYLEIIKKLNSLTGSNKLSPLSRSNFLSQSEEVSGDLAQMLALPSILKEKNIKLVYKFPWEAKIIGGATAHDPTNFETINQSKIGTPNLVFLQDSFSTSMRPWIAETFSTVHFLQINHFERQAVKDLEPDFVVQMLVERKLYSYQPHRFQ